MKKGKKYKKLHKNCSILQKSAKSSKITIYNLLTNFQASSASVFGEIKVPHGRVTSLQSFFDRGLSEMEKAGMVQNDFTCV